MMQARKIVTVLMIMAMMGVIMLGCTNNNEESAQPGESSPTVSAAVEQPATNKAEDTTATDEAASHSYVDYRGHKVEVPANPQRVIFAGETTGDLIELNIPLVGIFGDHLEGRRYQAEASLIENVGFPINVEKVTALNPDLIVFATTDEKEYEQLSKIAPTIVFDTFATLEVRMKELGVIFNKQQEAESWLEGYHAKAAAMWKSLYESVLKPGETASVFTYYPGDRLFVMARAGLPQLLYGEGGLKPTAPIQEVLDADEGFRQISLEVIGEFAGDHIFILDPVADEAKQSTEALFESAIWKTLLMNI